MNITPSTGKAVEGTNQLLNIVLFYRSPNSPDTNTDGLVELLSKYNKNTIFIGDLNLPRINWEDGTSDAKGCNIGQTRSIL